MATRPAAPRTKRASPSTTVRWTVAGFVVVALAGIAFLAYFHGGADRRCLALLPAEARAGIGLVEGEGGSKLDITASTASRGAQNEIQQSGFLACMSLVRGVETVDRNQAAFGLSTLGQLVDQWSADSGAFRVVMRNPGPVLDNFIIGPDQGHKADVMERWCAANDRCVTCMPNADRLVATSLSIMLKDDAPVRRELMPSRGEWAGPHPSYIDVVDGKRMGWACRPG